MEVIGIGDLHLSGINGRSGISKYKSNSDEYILSEVQRVVDQGEAIEHVLLYGDICDSPRMSYLAHQLLTSFFIKNKDRQFHIILGNHDKLAKTQGNSLELLPLFKLKNVHIYEKPTVVDIGMKINFLSYPYNEFKKNCLNVCHLDINGANDGKRKIVSDNIDNGCTIVSGHIHNFCEFKKVHYSGTLFPMNFGDSNKKYFHIIENYGNEFEVTNVPFKPKLILKTLRVKKGEKPELDDNIIYRLICEDPSPEFIKPNVYRVIASEDVDYLDDITFEYLDLNTENIFNKLIENMDNKDDLIRVRQECLYGVRNKR